MNSYGIRFIFFSLLGLINATEIFGQSKLDSLLRILPAQAEDTNKVRTLREISAEYQEIDFAKAIEYADKGIALSEKIGFKFGWARCVFTKGVCYDIAGESSKAVELIEQARAYFKNTGNESYYAATTLALGIAWYYGGDQNKALTYYLESIPEFEKLGQRKFVSMTLNNIAIIYRNQQKYENAIEIYKKSLVVKEKLGDEEGVAVTNLNMAIAYSYMKDEARAIEYINKAIDHYSSTNNLEELTRCKASLGISLLNQKKFVEAERTLEEANNEYLDPLVKGIHLLSLSKAECAQEKFEEALGHSQEALQSLGDELKGELRKQIYLELAVAHAGLREYENAYRFMQMHDSLASVLLSEERVKEMERLEEEFETKEKDKDLVIANLKIVQQEKSQQLLYAGIALAALLLLATMFIVWTKSRNNRKLADKNSIIEKALSDKEVLLREIHHRVKNNLQMVSSLLSIQSRSIEDEKAQEAITESRNRVKSMALIHQNLYNEESLTGINMRDYIGKLSESLFNTYKVDNDKVQLQTEVDDLVLDVDTTIPLGLILNELVTNALKYAFQGRAEGNLVVSLREQYDMLELKVQDNGVGIDTNKHSEESFGMKMIKSFAARLEATWEVKNENGTSVVMRIGKYKRAA